MEVGSSYDYSKTNLNKDQVQKYKNIIFINFEINMKNQKLFYLYIHFFKNNYYYIIIIYRFSILFKNKKKCINICI